MKRLKVNVHCDACHWSSGLTDPRQYRTTPCPACGAGLLDGSDMFWYHVFNILNIIGVIRPAKEGDKNTVRVSTAPKGE